MCAAPKASSPRKVRVRCFWQSSCQASAPWRRRSPEFFTCACRASCCSIPWARRSGHLRSWDLAIVFSNQIEIIADHVAVLGGWLLVIAIAGFAAYIGQKYIARQRFIRELRVSRITVEELKVKIDHKEEMVIVDLRHALDFEADPETIPGAFRIDAGELREKNDKLPRDRQIILYCTCPNEATSAQLAILLRKQGIQQIRPLQGGLDAWREKGYPVHNATLTQISGIRPAAPAAPAS